MYGRFDHPWPVISQPRSPRERAEREPSLWAIGLLIALIAVLIAIAALVFTPA